MSITFYRSKSTFHIFYDLFSFQNNCSKLILNGTLRQVTEEPGELKLYLVWPNTQPITFIARALSARSHNVISPTITMDLTHSFYSFEGKVRNSKYSIKDTLFK